MFGKNFNKNFNKSFTKNFTKNRGFTLIELTVVMAIIGILAALSINSFQSSQTKARDAQRKSDLKQIGNALEAYYNDYEQYPDDNAAHEIVGCKSGGSFPEACEWGQEWSDDHETVYMIELPDDPRSALNYYYESDGTYYKLYARLENERDGDVPVDGEGEPTDYGVACDADGEYNCNYGLASSNARIE